VSAGANAVRGSGAGLIAAGQMVGRSSSGDEGRASPLSAASRGVACVRPCRYCRINSRKRGSRGRRSSERAKARSQSTRGRASPRRYHLARSGAAMCGGHPRDRQIGARVSTLDAVAHASIRGTRLRQRERRGRPLDLRSSFGLRGVACARLERIARRPPLCQNRPVLHDRSRIIWQPMPATTIFGRVLWSIGGVDYDLTDCKTNGDVVQAIKKQSGGRIDACVAEDGSVAVPMESRSGDETRKVVIRFDRAKWLAAHNACRRISARSDGVTASRASIISVLTYLTHTARGRYPWRDGSSLSRISCRTRGGSRVAGCLKSTGVGGGGHSYGNAELRRAPTWPVC
jgi:hypothetical protein